MGMIDTLLGLLFGNGRNMVRDTAEVFRENAEAGAVRGARIQTDALAQFAAEFAGARKTRFDMVMDGINRLPRPAMALGTLGLFVAAMADPIWFAARMQGIALVPEPLWWLLGVVVSFYFGARHQAKAQTLQRDLAATLAGAPQVVANIEGLRRLGARTPGQADPGPDAAATLAATHPAENPALEEWRRLRAG
ncbi:MAG: holin family protein [Rhodobacteraceae bacterium]|nr:holin family protein [Paracoccaceae bacterium]